MRSMTVAEQLVVSKANDIIRHRCYFGDNDPLVSSIIGTDEVRLFNLGQGQKTENISTGADVTMRKCDTSLFGSNGMIPKSNSFRVFAIGVDIHLASVQANTPYTDDGIVTIDAAPVQVPNPYPIVDAIRSQGVFSLFRNATEFLEEGNVSDYPCGLYASGWGSDGSADVPAVTAGPLQAAYSVGGFILAQNGMAFRPLTAWYDLTELEQFYGTLNMQRPIDLTGTGISGYIDFLLVGQANVDRRSKQLVQNWG